MPTILTSIHGKRIGLDKHGRLIIDPKGKVSLTKGPRGGAAGLAYTADAASSAVTSTTTETLFDNFVTIPAGSLGVGSLIRVSYQGIATATNSTDTLAYKLYIGGLAGTALITAAAVDVANNDQIAGWCDIVIRTIGASGTFVASGWYKTTAAEGTATIKDDFTASTAIDTTVDQVIGVGATWSTTNVGNSARLDVLNAIVY